MDELGHGIYIPMDTSLLPPLYLIYAENPSDSGKVSTTYLSLSNVDSDIQVLCHGAKTRPHCKDFQIN